MSQLFDLSGKTAIVTGSGRGLGSAMARGLAAHGAQVVIGDRDREAAQQVAQSIQETGGIAAATFVDITQPQSCEELIQFTLNQFGQVDVLVNNAGIDIIKPALELSEAEWDKILAVDLKG